MRDIYKIFIVIAIPVGVIYLSYQPLFNVQTSAHEVQRDKEIDEKITTMFNTFKTEMYDRYSTSDTRNRDQLYIINERIKEIEEKLKQDKPTSSFNNNININGSIASNRK